MVVHAFDYSSREAEAVRGQPVLQREPRRTRVVTETEGVVTTQRNPRDNDRNKDERETQTERLTEILLGIHHRAGGHPEFEIPNV